MREKHDRYDDGYKLWRKRVLKRDKNKCQMPGCCSKKRKLQVHHIRTYAKNPTLRTDVSNGITLCTLCHWTIRNKETYYATLFDEVIRKNRK